MIWKPFLGFDCYSTVATTKATTVVEPQPVQYENTFLTVNHSEINVSEYGSRTYNPNVWTVKLSFILQLPDVSYFVFKQFTFST